MMYRLTKSKDPSTPVSGESCARFKLSAAVDRAEAALLISTFAGKAGAARLTYRT